MHKSTLIFTVILLLPVSFACASQSSTATLKGTAADSKISGTVQFTPVNDGLRVEVDVKGLSPGKHGFHIHEIGDCSDSGKAAGAHFNPDKHDHGEITKSGLASVHAGDLGNLEASADGTAHKELTIPGLTLTEGQYNISGRAVVVHEKEDDFSQPAGNAGGRIGCGTIQADA